MSVRMTSNELERRDAMGRAYNFSGALITFAPFELSDQILQHRVTCVREAYLWGHLRLLPQGGGAQALPNFGVPSSYAYTLCRRTTKFDTVTHMGRGLVFRGQSHPICRDNNGDDKRSLPLTASKFTTRETLLLSTPA